MAGPATTTRLSIVSLSALAATKSSSLTTEGIVAATAGLYTTLVADVNAANTSTSTTGPPAAATAAAPPCQPAQARSDEIINRIRSVRSAITPPYGLRTSAGMNRTSPAAPTQPSEPVR